MPLAMRTKEAILQKLATEQAKLAELKRELSTTRARIEALRAELHTPAANHQRFPLGALTSSLSDSSARRPTSPATHPAAQTNGSLACVISIRRQKRYARKTTSHSLFTCTSGSPHANTMSSHMCCIVVHYRGAALRLNCCR